MTPRALKLVALAYAVKTLIIAAAWLAVPDLPERVSARLSAAWSRVAPASQVQP
jgi:hypothetical protein